MLRLLVAILAGLAGAAIGLVAGWGLGAVLVEVFDISCFEGACGYYVVMWALLGGTLGLITGIAIAVFWRRGRATAPRAPISDPASVSADRSVSRPAPGRNTRSAAQFFGAIVAIACLVVGGGWLYYWINDDSVAGSNQAAPRLHYEVRFPAGTVLPERPSAVDVQLDTAKNQAWGQLDEVWAGEDDGRPTVSGIFELHFRSRYWILSISVPGGPRYLFTLPLKSAPRHMPDYAPWHRVDLIDDGTGANPRPATPADSVEIRYRVVWAGED